MADRAGNSVSPALLPARLAEKIRVADDGCWHWTDYLNADGYGRVRWNGRQPSCHRVVYMLLVGPIAEGLHLDHLCRVRHCVNPAHLEPVTPLENTRRSGSADYWRSKTHCPRNHPYDKANTYVTKRGARTCRRCARDKMRVRRGATERLAA